MMIIVRTYTYVHVSAHVHPTPSLQDGVSRKTNNPAARAGVVFHTIILLKKEIEREKLKPVSQHDATPGSAKNCWQ